jgi:hypothetical protein
MGEGLVKLSVFFSPSTTTSNPSLVQVIYVGGTNDVEANWESARAVEDHRIHSWFWEKKLFPKKFWGSLDYLEKNFCVSVSGTLWVVYSLSMDSGWGGINYKNNWISPPFGWCYRSLIPPFGGYPVPPIGLYWWSDQTDHNNPKETHMGVIADQLKSIITEMKERDEQLMRDTQDLITSTEQLTKELDLLIEELS